MAQGLEQHLRTDWGVKKNESSEENGDQKLKLCNWPLLDAIDLLHWWLMFMGFPTMAWQAVCNKKKRSSILVCSSSFGRLAWMQRAGLTMKCQDKLIMARWSCKRTDPMSNVYKWNVLTVGYSGEPFNTWYFGRGCAAVMNWHELSVHSISWPHIVRMWNVRCK